MGVNGPIVFIKKQILPTCCKSIETHDVLRVFEPSLRQFFYGNVSGYFFDKVICASSMKIDGVIRSIVDVGAFRPISYSEG